MQILVYAEWENRCHNRQGEELSCQWSYGNGGIKEPVIMQCHMPQIDKPNPITKATCMHLHVSVPVHTVLPTIIVECADPEQAQM